MNPMQNVPPINLPSIVDNETLDHRSDSLISSGGPNSPTSINTVPFPAISTNNSQNNNQNTEAELVAKPVLSTPPIADDVDLIEKEWVKKVNEVIHSTKDDPFERARQLSIIKQDYLQKRYNKIIKLS